MPVLFFAVHERWVKGLFAALLGLILALALGLPFIGVGSVTALVVLALASAVIGARTSPRFRIAAAWVGCWAVAIVFVVASARAREQVHAAVAAAFPSLRVADVVVTPTPANPLCWSALVAGVEGDTYRVVSASVALAPAVVDSDACPYDRRAVPTAPVSPVTATSLPALRWLWEYHTELRELRELARRLPLPSAAPLRPRPVPVVRGDGRWTAHRRRSSLRSFAGARFSDIALTAPIECPRHVPGWTPPRSDLLPGF